MRGNENGVNHFIPGILLQNRNAVNVVLFEKTSSFVNRVPLGGRGSRR